MNILINFDSETNHLSQTISPKIGILLVNLGTPDGTDYWSIRRYLSEFLSDKRVIELSSLLWQPILQGIILTFRPHRLGKSYQRIWDKEKNKSPLAVVTQSQAEQLRECFSNQNIIVEWAMRYGQPAIRDKIDVLIKQGCDQILIFPLYPQYSATTIASVNDAVFKAIMKYRKQPAIQTLYSFASDPDYIQALKEYTEQYLSSLSFVPEKILISFHGLPKRYVRAGDPYERECQQTAHALREALGKTENDMPLVYQSRFGPDKWLEPNITDVIQQEIQQGVRKIAVIAPGFLADCLETIDEINREYRDLFLEKGGKEFAYIPCLNDSDIAVNMMKKILKKKIQGWI